MVGRLLRAPLTWLVIVVIGAGAAFGLYWFQPWRLFTTVEVREDLPQIAAPEPTRGATPEPTQGAADPTGPADNTLLAAGDFVTQEHDTSGAVQLVRRADGRVQLVIRDLDTSDGPDLRVWLTDQPVRESRAGWRVFDDGEWVELGRLKGNRGDQVYEVPAGTDLTDLRSVSIWCKRFSVSFGAAELRPSS